MKEEAIVVACYGLLSKELEEYIKRLDMDIHQLTPEDQPIPIRALRMLQKLERQLASVESSGELPAIESLINDSIEKVNEEMGILEHIHAIVGLSMLSRYKEEWKGKKYAIGISWDDVNELYNGIEREYMKEGEDIRQYILNSQELADKLYEELLNGTDKK